MITHKNKTSVNLGAEFSKLANTSLSTVNFLPCTVTVLKQTGGHERE
jgi:hypothetical protein